MLITVFDSSKAKNVVVGDLTNGVFVKDVSRARHYLRIVSGYAIQCEVIDKYEIKTIMINETDTGDVFEISIESFKSNSKVWSHGHGKQYTISEKFLTKVIKGDKWNSNASVVMKCLIM